ncbi:shieldin complex subunit 2 isoform X4 [Dasypus novemcinctus]|uniref:shieldin complex subunit 2 isoform X4 n=1 Tax=Dasypus novemcinctus TaxID=9361 RepID=UPI00265DC760|nr:shieldin complex subunit 2 isoform X4 [Dasypus novemcinctus]XP_058155413.1 shieldin complex subunit 2 isoform X4 [Dasypus novemcinctus]XP_058155414.1 shieldin complex subunit 2 isoform X4 [Dasypus novemcinctus]
MSGKSQVHIFFGAPAVPLKMTASQEPASIIPTPEPWRKIQFLCSQHSLPVKDDSCKHRNLKEQVREATGSAELLRGGFVASSRTKSPPLRDDSRRCISEAQNIKFQKSRSSGMSDVANCGVQVRELEGGVQPLTAGETPRQLPGENEIPEGQHSDPSGICSQQCEHLSSQAARRYTAVLDLVCSTRQTKRGPGALEAECVPHEIQNQRPQCFPSRTVDEPGSNGAVSQVSACEVSTDTEFLSILASSQIALLAQRQHKGQDSANKGAIPMESEPRASEGDERVTDDNLPPSRDGAYGNGQEQAHSLELFSPVCPETVSSHIHINAGKGLEENTAFQELFSSEDKLPPTEICIEPCGSGILCSQQSAFCPSSPKRSRSSEEKLGHSKAPSRGLPVSEKTKLLSHTEDPAVTVGPSNASEFKRFKKTSLIKNCDYKSWKYNCLVMVLLPCYVKEINIKSGPSSGSKVPLATMVVIDQSETRKKVFLWRTAAFWALTVFPGDIVLLTDVTIREDQWAGDTVLQTTFTSQLLNLGSYSSVQPEEYSGVVSAVVLRGLLAYASSKHPHLAALPRRQPQNVSSVEFVELERLQPDVLVHVILRVVDISVLTEASYSYRGQKQRKAMLTVEQAQGQHYMLVLWGPGEAWHPQLQRRKGVILIKPQILELTFPVTTAQKTQIALNARSSLESIFSSFPNIIYTGCAKCGLELETDENKIYKQCFSCLPFSTKKPFYRPALMTVVDGSQKVCIHVGSEMIEKILLNISADLLNRVIVPSSEITYRMVAADVLHSLLADRGAPCTLEVQSLFVLDENSYPLQQDFYLLDFHPEPVE